MADDGFLRRWARRKQQAREDPAASVAPPVAPAPPSVGPGAAVPGAVSGVPATRPSGADARPAAAPARVENADDAAPATLPPLESLTPESDFAPFVKAGVDASTRNAALRTLFSDPHFNVMDGLDIYIDDYSKPSPMPLSMLRSLNQARTLGLVEDEPPEADTTAGARAQVAQNPAASDRPGDDEEDEGAGMTTSTEGESGVHETPEARAPDEEGTPGTTETGES